MTHETKKRSVLVALGAAAVLFLLSGCFLFENEAPVASFDATPWSGSAPLSVSFDARDSYDPDGSIESYSWSFGDGSSGAGALATHVFASPGTYPVELTVRDAYGASSTWRSEITATSGEKYAILVGIATYPPAQPSLTYTDDDAYALRERLLSLPGWDADHIILLTNGQATSTAFRAALNILGSRSADDMLLVFFSGHGSYYLDMNGDEADGYDEALLFYDADVPLLDDTLALWLEDVPMSHVAVFIDSCFSGGQLDSQSTGGMAASGVAPGGPDARDGDFLEDLARVGKRGTKDLDRVAKQLVAVTASSADQYSWELATLQHGIFTYALLEALDGRADASGDADGLTSAEECYAYLSPRVLLLALSVGEIETPQLLDHCAGELEIAGTP